MNGLILALSTIVSLGVDLYRQPSAQASPPIAEASDQGQEASRVPASHVRRAPDASRSHEVGRTEVLDPCGGMQVVSGVVSEETGRVHTCYCTPITGLQGELVKYDVACF